MTLTIIGAGGHALTVYDAARSQGWNGAQVVDDDVYLWGKSFAGDPDILIEGPISHVLEDVSRTAVFALGDNQLRLAMANGAQCSFATIVHHNAHVHRSCAIRPNSGTVILLRAIIQPGCAIGSHCIINTGAQLDHGCKLGDGVHVGPGAILAGDVTVKDGAMIGAGAIITPGVCIGANATVGAGAVVLRDVGAGDTVVGSPARPV
jgi:sugar O-acyltransferase (sialic acid O-acetyltransferase NeuD family)